MSKNRNEIDVVNDKYKSFKIDITNFNDSVTTIHYIGINNNDVMLRWRKLGF